MYYVRHDNRQAKTTDKQKAWADAQKLRCSLDIYDSTQKSVVWGTYRLTQCIEIDGESRWEILGYAKDPRYLRSAFAETRPEVWSLSQYDWDDRSWKSIKHS